MRHKTKVLRSKQAERRLLKLNWPLSLTLSPRAGRGEPREQVPGYAAAITGITVNSAYEMGHSIEHAGFKMGEGKKKPSGDNQSAADKAKHEKIEAAKGRRSGKG